MILTVDIGNTNIVVGVFDNSQLLSRYRLSSDTQRTSDEYAVLLAALLSKQCPLSAVDALVIGSVVPVLSDTLDSALQQLFHRKPFHVTHATPMAVKNCYAKPNEVGVDRLANAVGGTMIYGAPLIIVDIGTAVTLDVVSKDSEYLGGAILPGIEISAEALARKTARLPRVAPHEPHQAIGRTTVESIRSGLLNGMVGAIDRLLEDMWKELGYTTPTVATGGLAQVLIGRSRYVNAIHEDLTLQGLLEIYRFNHS